MPTVAEVVRRYGPAYLERFGDRDAGGAQEGAPRTSPPAGPASWGRSLYRCEDCGRMHAVGRSCGDRHCPSCQRDKAEAWLATQVDRLLPCPYFLVTFTLPAELREVARSHQRAVYAALFRASSEALRALVADPQVSRHGSAGLLRRAAHLGPDAGVSPPRPLRRPRRRAERRRRSLAGVAADFLVPVKAAVDRLPGQVPRPARATRACWRQVDPSVWRRDWVVHCQPAGDGRQSLRYLAPYVFRVAIGDHRIVSCDDGRVTFTLPEGGIEASTEDDAGRAGVPAAVTCSTCCRRASPKVRHYGFLSPAAGVSLDLVRWLIALWAGLTYVLRSVRDEGPAAAPGEPTCAACGGRLVRLGFVPAAGPSAFDTS